MKAVLLTLGAGICLAQSTIPAGQVGNQNRLAIVTERSYSHYLEATVYQFTTIQQIEPPASLFQISSGYTVEEEGQ